jgi:hypothetical protein
MYEALSGVSPFLSDNPIRTIFRHLNEDAQDLTKVSLVQKVSILDKILRMNGSTRALLQRPIKRSSDELT